MKGTHDCDVVRNKFYVMCEYVRRSLTMSKIHIYTVSETTRQAGLVRYKRNLIVINISYIHIG